MGEPNKGKAEFEVKNVSLSVSPYFTYFVKRLIAILKSATVSAE